MQNKSRPRPQSFQPVLLALCAAAAFSACELPGGPVGWPTYVVVYHANDESERTQTSATIRHGDAHYLKGEIFLLAGNAFYGWATSPYGGARDFAPGQQVRAMATGMRDVINLFAIWHPHRFTLVYHPNNGDVEPVYDEREFVFGVAKNLLPLPKTFYPPSRDYVFVGWSLSPRGSVAVGDQGCAALLVPETDNAVITLYAVWVYGVFTVVFDANGGQGDGPAPIDVYAGRYTTLPHQHDLSREGHTFGGWNTMPDGSGSAHRVGDRFEPTGNVTLYARWIPDGTIFIVTFDMNGGTENGLPPMQVPAGENRPLPNQFESTKEGHVFGGWNTSADGSGNGFLAGGGFEPIEDVTLYAVWQLAGTAAIAISFDANGGEGAVPGPQLGLLGQILALPVPDLEKTGHTFMGWSTDGNATNGALVFSVGSSNVTLYAIWSAVFVVTFDANGGTGPVPEPRQGITGDGISIPDPGGLERGNDFFVGWNTRPTQRERHILRAAPRL